jgi:putative FmdB family regulatory protein
MAATVTARGTGFKLDFPPARGLSLLAAMPTYEYRCKKCSHRFEVFQSIKDAPKKTCPKCKGRVERLIGAGAGLLFKGSGFYITDYRSESYKSAAKSESSAGAASKAPAESKPAAESKPSSGGQKPKSGGSETKK